MHNGQMDKYIYGHILSLLLGRGYLHRYSERAHENIQHICDTEQERHQTMLLYVIQQLFLCFSQCS